jgi:hypothetical protein
MARYVTLGDGRRISLGHYVRAWRTTLAAPATQRFAGSPCDPLTQCSRDDVLRDYRDGLHDRINRHIPGYGKGRKWSPDWQRAALQAGHAVNTPRLIVRWVPRDLYARLAHRLG